MINADEIPSDIRRLLDAIDDAIETGRVPPGIRELIIMGGSAVLLHDTNALRTRDIDVVANDLTPWSALLEIFGKNKDESRRLGLYLEVVFDAMPPLKIGYKSRTVQVVGPWKHILVAVMAPIDLVLSKLRRFSAKDKSDIRVLCDRFPAEITEQSLNDAFVNFAWDRPDWEEICRANLDRVILYIEGEVNSI